MVIAWCHSSVSVEEIIADCFFSDILCKFRLWYCIAYWLNFCSTVNVLLGIDEVQKSILVLELFIDFFQLRAGFDHVFFIGKQDKTFFPCQGKSLAKDSKHLSDCEVLRHHEPITEISYQSQIRKFYDVIENHQVLSLFTSSSLTLGL